MTSRKFNEMTHVKETDTGFMHTEDVVATLPQEQQNAARFGLAATGVKGFEIVMIDEDLWEGGGGSDDYGLSIRDPKSEEESKSKIERPKKYKVIFHNDDQTPFDYVEDVLNRFFNKTSQEAEQIASVIHLQGQATVAILPRIVAEKKTNDVNAYSRQTPNPWYGGVMQLRVTCEPE